jgi:hypothetical protein
MQKLQVKRKNRTQSKKKTTTKKIKKNTAKKPLVKKPNQMSYPELKNRCMKFQNRLYESVKKIVEFDGHSFRDRPFTSYVMCLFLCDSLYNQTTSPFFHKFHQHLEHNPDDREKLKLQIKEEYLNDAFTHMNKQKLISVVNEYISGGAGGRFSSQLEKIHNNFLEDTYE